MDELENQELSLDDILREFGAEPMPEQQEEVPADTIRLDEIQDAVAQVAGEEDPTAVFELPEEPVQPQMEQEPAAEPFSEAWEPEYEEPVAEFSPAKPIAFENKTRLRQLRRDIVSGPEQRFYSLQEQGTGKLKLGLLVNTLLFLVLAAVTVMQAMGLVPPERLKLVVFVQFGGLLLSGILGSGRMIDGFFDMLHLRFTANSMLLMTFIACCADGVFCLMEQRMGLTAIFVLEMSMAMWAAVQQRNTEMSQMDTLRRASRLDSVVSVRDYHQGKTGFCTGQGQIGDFMDHYQQTTGPEKVMRWYGFAVLLVAIGLGITGVVLHNWSDGVQILAAALLLGLPATAFIFRSRPEALLEKRLHKLGSVLCGWKGVRAVSRKAVCPIEDKDLFPVGAIKLSGTKFFGKWDPDQVVAYATAVVKAGGGSLVGLFSQLLDSRNGYYFTVEEFKRYHAGIGGVIGNYQVMVGTRQFMEEMGVDMSQAPKLSQAVYAAVDGELSGVFALSYHKHKATAAGLQTLCSYFGLEPMVLSEDFMVNESFMRTKFGINTKRIRFPQREEFLQMLLHQPQEGDPVVALSIREGLAPKAFAITGARVLKATMRTGLVVHMIGGILGLLITAALAVVGITDFLTPVNVLLYELLWLVPGWLVTEWTRSV